MTRQYIPYLLKGPKRGPFVKWYNPGLRPMTHHEACTFISKQTEPASWGVEEITAETAAKVIRQGCILGEVIDPCWPAALLDLAASQNPELVETLKA